MATGNIKGRKKWTVLMVGEFTLIIQKAQNSKI